MDSKQTEQMTANVIGAEFGERLNEYSEGAFVVLGWNIPRDVHVPVLVLDIFANSGRTFAAQLVVTQEGDVPDVFAMTSVSTLDGGLYVAAEFGGGGLFNFGDRDESEADFDYGGDWDFSLTVFDWCDRVACSIAERLTFAIGR